MLPSLSYKSLKSLALESTRKSKICSVTKLMLKSRVMKIDHELKFIVCSLRSRKKRIMVTNSTISELKQKIHNKV